MTGTIIAVERLDSWKDIAAHLNCNVRTAIRWEKDRGLPIRRVPGGKRQTVFAYRHEIDQWLMGSEFQKGLEDTSNPLSRTGGTEPSAVATADQAESFPETVWQQPPRRNFAILLTAGVIAAISFLVISSLYILILARQSIHPIQLTGLQQLTANGHEKHRLLLAGSQLYFGQEEGGWYSLATMPVDGGSIRTLWNPPMHVVPEDISPDGKQLLALTYMGVERERPMWIVPLDGGEPHSLPDLRSHSGAWSPDGRKIAFASGSKIYLMSSDATGVRQIASFAEVPDMLRWSADGRHLRFLLLDVDMVKQTYWEMSFADDMGTTSIRPLPLSIGTVGEVWSRETTEDSALVFTNNATANSAWAIEHGARWWEPAVRASEFHTGLGPSRGVAYNLKASRVFLISEAPARSKLIRFLPHTQEFRNLLPGISGLYLEYSPDAHWMTYINAEDGTLWASHADGTGLRQLTNQSRGPVELPRWSPDGKSIAYMNKRPGKPWRIFIQARDGGEPREASEGNDNQGAPTWSPDGRYIVYGNVECQAAHLCAIHRIDISTGRVQTLPGSDGFGTARWAPNGRYIAAMQPEQHQLFLFDTSTQQWKKLADGMNGMDLNWSRDSKFLYTNLPGTDARIVRLSIPDAKIETILNFRGQDDLNLAETSDLGFSIAPDDSIILRRKMNAAEIYSYTLRDQ